MSSSPPLSPKPPLPSLLSRPADLIGEGLEGEPRGDIDGETETRGTDELHGAGHTTAVHRRGVLFDLLAAVGREDQLGCALEQAEHVAKPQLGEGQAELEGAGAGAALAPAARLEAFALMPFALLHGQQLELAGEPLGGLLSRVGTSCPRRLQAIQPAPAARIAGEV